MIIASFYNKTALPADLFQLKMVMPLGVNGR